MTHRPFSPPLPTLPPPHLLRSSSPRPGVAKLIDQALSDGVKVTVCSTSNEKAVSAIVSFLLGPETAEKIKIFAGDVVPRKKPDPTDLCWDLNDLFVLGRQFTRWQPPHHLRPRYFEPCCRRGQCYWPCGCKAAGMKCIVTKSRYTAEEDFVDADAVLDCIGDPRKSDSTWPSAEAFSRSSS